MARDTVRIGEVNWLSDIPTEGRRVTVKLRSTQAATPAVLHATAGGAELILDAPQTGVSPGQAAVFYDGPRVLGGGWIKATGLRADSDLRAGRGETWARAAV